MTKIFQKQNTAIPLAKEENFLNWNEILEKFKEVFGNDIYESWIKNINFKKEFNHYIVLSAPTRFVRLILSQCRTYIHPNSIAHFFSSQNPTCNKYRH